MPRSKGIASVVATLLVSTARLTPVNRMPRSKGIASRPAYQGALERDSPREPDAPLEGDCDAHGSPAADTRTRPSVNRMPRSKGIATGEDGGHEGGVGREPGAPLEGDCDRLITAPQKPP